MKTTRSLILLLFFGCYNSLFSQVTEGESKLRTMSTDTVEGWKKGGVVSLSLAQTSLTNWAAGGQNSFAINGLFSVFANYKTATSVWDNSLDLGYGLLKQGKNSDFMKTDDKIDLLSKFGKKAFNNFFYAALFNFKTQMTEGKDYAKDTSKISNFFAPTYLIGSIGLDYKPNSYFSAFIAPVTSKITIVTDQDLANAGAYGVKAAEYNETGELIHEGENSKSEFGGYLRIIYSKNDFKKELLKNVSLLSKVDFFSNYLSNPQNIDVSWETQLVFQVNKFINVNMNTHLIYDDDIKIAKDTNADGVTDELSPRVQFKEILGVGVIYKF